MLWVFASPLVPAATRGRSTSHTFTDSTGKTYDAQVLAIRNGEVNIRQNNGKVYSVDINTLSKADRDYLKIWSQGGNSPKDSVASSESAITVNVTVEPASATKDSASLLTPKITLRNQDYSQNYKGLRGTLILLGQQSADPAHYKVLSVEKFSGNVPAQKKIDFTGKPLDKNPASATSSAPAYAYTGYLFVLQNSAEDIIQFQHSGIYIDSAADALKIKTGDVLDKPMATTEQTIRLVRAPDTWGPIPTDAQPTAPGHT